MKKQFIYIILMLIISCLVCLQMYSINYLYNESFLQRLGDKLDELTIQGLHRSGNPRLLANSERIVTVNTYTLY